MAQHKSASKRARSAKRRAAGNRHWKTRVKNAIKRVRSATNKNSALEQLGKTVKLLDQLAAKGVIHQNKVSNDKSKLSKFVHSLS